MEKLLIFLIIFFLEFMTKEYTNSLKNKKVFAAFCAIFSLNPVIFLIVNQEISTIAKVLMGFEAIKPAMQITEIVIKLHNKNPLVGKSMATLLILGCASYGTVYTHMMRTYILNYVNTLAC